MELQPGALLRVGDKELVEYVGVHDSKIVARVNPDQPAEKGAIHRLFTPDQLEKDAVKVGPFSEVFPYSDHVREELAWAEKFPGMVKEIPYPPQELVTALNRGKEEGITSFKPHYLPSMMLTQRGMVHNERFYPNPERWLPLMDWFWSEETREKVSSDTLAFHGNWVLIDTTINPNYDFGDQMYPDDQLRPLLIKLEAEGLIAPPQPGSRFNLPWDVIYDHIMPRIAGLFGVRPENTRFPTAEEMNVLGNMFFSDYKKSGCFEFFDNKYGNDERLYGGDSKNESPRFVQSAVAGSRGVSHAYGFRPIIVFPAKEEGKK